MLGKLFSRNPTIDYPSSLSKPESVQEDLHTRSLLFPDAYALFQHRADQVFPLVTPPGVLSPTVNVFDYDADIELEERDVRVLVMQGASHGVQPCMLYDSHVPAISTDVRLDSPTQLTSTPTARDSSRSGMGERRGSFYSQSTAPDTDAARATRMYQAEVIIYSNCIFASSELMTHRGMPITKVHVLPAEARPLDLASSVPGEGRGSSSRAAARASKLSQSVNSDTTVPGTSMFPVTRSAERRKVLVTRLFTVGVPAEEPSRGSAVEDNGEKLPGSPRLPAKKIPLYAIGLILQLPKTSSALGQDKSGSSDLRTSSSFTEQSLASLHGAARKSGTQGAGGSWFGNESFESSYTVDLESQFDVVAKHWVVIQRALSRLQASVTSILLPMLRQLDVTVPQSAETRFSKPAVLGTTHLFLPRMCLSSNRRLTSEAMALRSSIVNGLRASRVVTGQGRWGIWRDEARTIVKHLGLPDANFVYVLMTAFLAIHTEWMQALCPAEYKRRYFELLAERADDDAALPARTIVVTPDKIAARRVVFLLSAFLPANPLSAALRSRRASTPASASRSPPTFGPVPIARSKSLRRKVKRSQSDGTQPQTHGSPPTLPANHTQASPGRKSEERSSPDLSLIQSPARGTGDHKSSIASMATTLPGVITIPHFATPRHNHDRFPSARPGSSGSMAADDLKRSLTKSNSNSISQGSSAPPEPRGPQNFRWGNVISGLWNPSRRDASVIGSNSSLLKIITATHSPETTLESDRPPLTPPKGHQGQMSVPQSVDIDFGNTLPLNEHRDSMEFLSQRQVPSGRRVQLATESQVIPRARISSFDSPVNTKFNPVDNVIDVDIGIPDYLTALESQSPSATSSCIHTSTYFDNSWDAFEYTCRPAKEDPLSLNAAGWLREFHPDFAVQAVPPRPDLLKQVMMALRAEPTPKIAADQPINRWMDVSSALVVDLSTHTIMRLRYRRFVQVTSPVVSLSPSQALLQAGSLPTSLLSSALPTTFPPTRTEPSTDRNESNEEFVKETIASIEPCFVEAIAKVMAHSVPKGGNTAPSTASSAVAAVSSIFTSNANPTKHTPTSSSVLPTLTPEPGSTISAASRHPTGQHKNADVFTQDCQPPHHGYGSESCGEAADTAVKIVGDDAFSASDIAVPAANTCGRLNSPFSNNSRTGALLPLSLVSSPNLPNPAFEVPRDQCRDVILSALEDLMVDVIAARKSHPDAMPSPNAAAKKIIAESRRPSLFGGQPGLSHGPSQQQHSGNILREAIQAWIAVLDAYADTVSSENIVAEDALEPASESMPESVMARS